MLSKLGSEATERLINNPTKANAKEVEMITGLEIELLQNEINKRKVYLK